MAYTKIRGSLNPQAKKEFQALLSKIKEEKQDEDEKKKSKIKKKRR